MGMSRPVANVPPLTRRLSGSMSCNEPTLSVQCVSMLIRRYRFHQTTQIKGNSAKIRLIFGQGKKR